MDDEEDQLMQPGATSSAATVGSQQRRKRARHGVKIKRNRKITSCLACRERKQKVSLESSDGSDLGCGSVLS